MSTTFCTFTYNDARLAQGLLASIPEWTLQPDEVIVVDDGSDTAFTVEPSLAAVLPLRIIRFEENRGFSAAKSEGINTASGDIILAADCDARVHPDYLKVCARHLAQPEVGMVSGECLHLAGTDMLSRYLALFGDNFQVSQTGLVDYIPGLAFALRREVWQETGGFSGHTRAVCEDIALCRAIKSKGYALLMDKSIPVRQVRRLTRTAHCRRLWIWCGQPLVDGTEPSLSLPDQFLGLFVHPMLKRTAHIGEKQDPALVYYEVLYASYIALELCHALGQKGILFPDAAKRFVTNLEQKLAPFPMLLRLLKSDLLQLGVLPPKQGSTPSADNSTPLARECDWEDVFCFADIFTENKVFTWLNNTGVRLILEEDASLEADFSSYMHMKIE